MSDLTDPRKPRAVKGDLLPGSEGTNSRARTLLLGLGNSLRGDDGVGIAVVDSLADSADLPGDMVLGESFSGDPFDVLLDSDRQRVIVIDAVEIGKEPGEWTRFTLQEARLLPNGLKLAGDEHRGGLAEALALGESLGFQPPEIIIYAVQPYRTDWAAELSQLVKKAVPNLRDAILKELHSGVM